MLLIVEPVEFVLKLDDVKIAISDEQIRSADAVVPDGMVAACSPVRVWGYSLDCASL